MGAFKAPINIFTEGNCEIKIFKRLLALTLSVVTVFSLCRVSNVSAERVSPTPNTISNYVSLFTEGEYISDNDEINAATNITDTYTLYATIIGISDLNAQYMARAYFVVNGQVYLTNVITRNVSAGLS